MSRIIALLASLVFGVIAAVSPASADHACDSTVVDGGGNAYLVVDNLENEHGGVWLYAESNGEPGLQRDDDSCRGNGGGDTIIL